MASAPGAIQTRLSQRTAPASLRSRPRPVAAGALCSMAPPAAPPQVLLLKHGPGWGLPSVSAGCIQAEAYLRIAGVPFAEDVLSTAGTSPTGVRPTARTRVAADQRAAAPVRTLAFSAHAPLKPPPAQPTAPPRSAQPARHPLGAQLSRARVLAHASHPLQARCRRWRSRSARAAMRAQAHPTSTLLPK